MLQHSTNDFYDLSTSISVSRQTPPSYSPNGTASLNNNTIMELNSGSAGTGGGSNTASSNLNNERDAITSFGFTQEQVACVCEVRYFYYSLKNFLA